MIEDGLSIQKWNYDFTEKIAIESLNKQPENFYKKKHKCERN